MGWTWSRTARSIGQKSRLRRLIEVDVLERTKAKPLGSVKASGRPLLGSLKRESSRWVLKDLLDRLESRMGETRTYGLERGKGCKTLPIATSRSDES